MTNTTNSLTLVTGATGTTGRRVAHRLAERGLAVRAGSRNGTPPFDWHHPATWPAALDGVTAAYLAYHPDLVAPGAVDTVRRFARTAVEAGARRPVLLSGRGEPAAQELIGAPVEVFGTVLDGRGSHLADGVRQALGREPLDFTDYARATAATGVWASPTAGEPAPATEGGAAR